MIKRLTFRFWMAMERIRIGYSVARDLRGLRLQGHKLVDLSELDNAITDEDIYAHDAGECPGDAEGCPICNARKEVHHRA